MKKWLWLLMVVGSLHGQAKQEREVWQYCRDGDVVTHAIARNQRFGSSSWSYEQNYRRPAADRVTTFKAEDIVGKSLMDFGCNEGGVLLACKEVGAGAITGIDYNGWCIGQAEKKARQKGYRDATFLVGDLEDRGLYLDLPEVDTVFLLAVLKTSGFQNRQGVISNVARKARHALYYEGHRTASTHVPAIYQLMVATDFSRFEYLGRFAGRLLIRYSREMLRAEEIPPGAVTSDDPDEVMMEAEEIYVFTDSKRNPPFSNACQLIQYVRR